MIQVYDKYGKIKSSGIPGYGTVTAVSSGNLSPLFTTAVTSPTSTPNISFSPISQSQKLFYASPNGSSGTPTFRAILASDLPSLSSIYVPTSRTITINGVTYDLSSDRSWTIAASSVNWGSITGTITDQTDLITYLSTNYVPYTGATGNVDLGEYQLKAGQIEFDQSPTGTAGTAIMRWNDTDGTVDLGLKGGNVTLQVGQESVVRVVNKTGGNLLESNYQVVRVRLVSEGGAAGQRLAVVLAQANNDTNSATTLGIVTENINNNQEGFITVFGSVREINTTGSLQGETWVDGDILYLSPTTPGQLTNIKPSAPQHLVTVGYVEYAHAIHGKIFVKVDNGYELDELHNVDITSPVNNDVLTYNSSTQVWENKGITTALGYTPENAANKSSSYSVSSTVTYPNTKALVDGLATKGTVIETTTDGTVTSPLVNTVSQVLLIPGGTFGEGMTLETLGWARKTGVNGPLTYRRYVNTTPNLVGSPILIAQPGASASATVYAGLRRFLRIKTSDGSGVGTELTNVSSTSYDDVPGTSTTAVSNVSINWNNDVYIIDALQCSSASDSARVSSLKVRR